MELPQSRTDKAGLQYSMPKAHQGTLSRQASWLRSRDRTPLLCSGTPTREDSVSSHVPIAVPILSHLHLLLELASTHVQHVQVYRSMKFSCSIAMILKGSINK